MIKGGVMMTGTIDVNMDNFSTMVNKGSELGANVTTGVATQGDLIGMAVGLVIALTLLFGVVFLILSYIVKLIKEVKNMRHA